MESADRSEQTSAPTPGVGDDEATAAYRAYQTRGDRAALEHALQLCVPTLLRVARGRTGHSDVDDLVHECLVVAIRAAAPLPPSARLMPWLLGILQNKLRTRHLLRWRRQTLTPAVIGEVAGAEPDPALHVQRRQWAELIAERVRELPPRYRAVVEAHLLHGEELAAVAGRTNTSPSTVRNQYARGLELLRRRLPAPLLAGLLAMLAVREAHAQRNVALGGPRRYGVFAVALVLVAVGTLMWPGGVASPPAAFAAVVPAAAAVPVTVEERAAHPLDRDVVATADPNDGVVEVHLHLRSGDPAVGVPVLLDPQFRAVQPVHRVAPQWRIQHTDGAGTVSFTGLAHGPAALRLHDLALLHTFQVGRSPQCFDFVVPDPTIVDVTVVDEGDQPIEGAEVLVSGAAGGRAPGFLVAVTGGEGRARLVLPMTTAWFWVRSAAHEQSGVYRIALEAPSGGERASRCQIRLRKSSLWCRAAVVSAAGAPLADAVVGVYPFEGKTIQIVRTVDATGCVAIGALAPGRYRVAAVAPGFAATAVAWDTDAGPLVLRLESGGSLQGHLVGIGALGRSAAELRVVTMRGDGGPWTGLEDVVGGVAEDGTFVVPHVVAGRHTVGLFAGGSQPVAVTEVDVENGAATVVDLSLPPASTQRVCVRDERGHPIPGAVVVVQRRQRWLHWLWQRATCDAEGVVHMSLRGGNSRTLFVYAPVAGDVRAWPCLEREFAAQADTVDIVVPDAALEVGCVRGQMGTDTAYFHLVTENGLELRRDGTPTRTIRCLVDGSFVVEDLPPGHYEVATATVDAGGRNAVRLAAFDLGSGETKQLDLTALAPPVEVAITLPPEAAASPVPCRLYSAAGRLLQTFTVPLASTLHRRLPPGRYRCEFPSREAATCTQEFLAADAQVNLLIGRQAGMPCRLEVHGHNPHAFPMLADLRRSGAEVGTEVVLHETDPSLHAVELDLAPGTYELRVPLFSGEELHGSFVVGQRPGTHVFPFRAP